MYQYYMFLISLLLCLIGLLYHYYEKKNLHFTTQDTLREYLFHDKRSTLNAFSAILAAAYGIAIIHPASYSVSLLEIGGSLAAGYGLDNMFNKASDAPPKVGEQNG